LQHNSGRRKKPGALDPGKMGFKEKILAVKSLAVTTTFAERLSFQYSKYLGAGLIFNRLIKIKLTWRINGRTIE
jgi:hypothetical protein